MKRGLAVVGMLVVIAFVGAAQDSAKSEVPKAVINIPFQFYADGTLLPAGTYEFRANAEGTHIEMRNTKGEDTLVVPVLTSLSLRKIDQAEAVFDVLGQDHYLSEFYVKGMDGFAFNGAPGKHSHQTIESGK
ncbi:MAG: hypothetical protein ABSC02_10720 [Acidobacteriota bacterium]|jgi:hypothetical protein